MEFVLSNTPNPLYAIILIVLHLSEQHDDFEGKKALILLAMWQMPGKYRPKDIIGKGSDEIERVIRKLDEFRFIKHEVLTKRGMEFLSSVKQDRTDLYEETQAATKRVLRLSGNDSGKIKGMLAEWMDEVAKQPLHPDLIERISNKLRKKQILVPGKN